MLTFMVQEKDGERYRRQLIIPGWGDAAQAKLASAAVFIAGAGGLGSAASLYLAAAGVGRIRIADRDRVELSNLNRQILHDEKGIGREKSASAFERLSGLNSSVRIEAVTASITDETVSGLVAGCGIIVDCLDSFAARHVLNRYSVRTGTPMVHAGIAAGGGQLAVFSPPAGPCLSCLFPESDTREQQDGPVPVFGAAVGAAGAMEAAEAIKLLTGLGEPLVGRLLVFDLLYSGFHTVTVEKNPECPVCGDGREAFLRP